MKEEPSGQSKLTTMFAAVTKEHQFFLLSADENVLLTLSDDAISVPLVEKKLLGNLRVWADEAAAGGDYEKAQSFEDRAVKLLPRVLELTNLHEFATRAVKHARIALAAATRERDFRLQGRLTLFLEKVVGRLAKGDTIMKGIVARQELAVVRKTSVVAESLATPSASGSFTEAEGDTSVSEVSEIFRPTAPSMFARKRKLHDCIGDGTRTVSLEEKDTIPFSHKMSNTNLLRILKNKKSPETPGPLTLEGQSYRLEDPSCLSRPYCQACNKVVTKKHLRTHALTASHKKSLEAFNSGQSRNVSLKIYIHDHRARYKMTGSTLPGDTKLFRLKLVTMMAKANISTSAFVSIKEEIEGWAGHKAGARRQLNDYWPIHHRLWHDHLQKFVTKEMFHQFGIIVDGTPSFAAAEAFKLRAVSLEWNIVEVLLRVTLLAKAPDAQGLASSITEVMTDFGLPFKNLRAAIKDRAATNQAAVNLLKDHHGITPFAGDCNAHTLSHVPEKNKIPNFEVLRKQWGKAIQHGGNCPLRFRESFGMTPKKGRGVRFYVYWEQCVQMNHVGLVKLHSEVINHCIEKKWSEKSCRKYHAAASKPDVLARAIVECCAASSAGKAFCHGTYWLEVVFLFHFSIHISILMRDGRLLHFRATDSWR